MRLPAYLLLGTTSLFATTSIVESLVIQGSALAILGWAVWYLLTKALPREREIFLHAQRETRRAFCESLQSLSHSLECLVAAVTGTPVSLPNLATAFDLQADGEEEEEEKGE